MILIRTSFLLLALLILNSVPSLNAKPSFSLNFPLSQKQGEVKKAQFPGGSAEYENWLIQNFYYPEGAKRYGAVIVEFVVSKSGKCKDFAVIKSIDPELDLAAVEILKAMPKWEPATKNGEAVESKVKVPLRFLNQSMD